MTNVGRFYAQFGEDQALDALFGGKTEGLCVEVGANDGLHGSNTLFFEKLGWDCILIEPNPELCTAMRCFRTAQLFEVAASDSDGKAVLQVATGAAGAHAVSTMDAGAGMRTLRAHGFDHKPVEVVTRRLDMIFDEVVGSRRIDFMTIDVEGHEMAALSGLSLDRWRPRVLIIESNSTAAGVAVADHLRGAGYVRFRRTGVNDWYAHLSDPQLATTWRRGLYFPSRFVANSKMTATATKLWIRGLPGVLPVWNLGKRLFDRSETSA